MDPFYGRLLIYPLVLIFFGVFTILIAIPVTGLWFKNSPATTEFHGVRIAVWCVVAGLATVLLIVLGALIQHIASELS
jgi:hypothetical protein